jgi:hypothetical protein
MWGHHRARAHTYFQFIIITTTTATIIITNMYPKNVYPTRYELHRPNYNKSL